MALTGLEIYKQLPKKNCGECGVPTCLAFAMALASGKAALDACPYVTDAARENLDSAAAPPIKAIKFGKESVLGDETVLFRHDKTFYHPTTLLIQVSDTLNDEELNAKIAEIKGLEFERVGLQYTIDGVAVIHESGDAARFAKVAAAVAEATDISLLLLSSDAGALKVALEPLASRKPLIGVATAENYEAMVNLAKDNSVPVILKADGLDALEELVVKATALGYKEFVLDPGARTPVQTLANLTHIRRLAIKKKFRPFGYPVIAFTSNTEPMEEVMEATVYVAKYASAVVLKTSKKAHVLPLMTLRQNIYTDPQKPIQVEPKLHSVGNVNENSPFYITTNFSLTYYSVEGEVETSKIPSYILPIDTDGTSVLTAYAAGKFEPEKIVEAMVACGIADKVKHRNVIIPGYVAVISGKLSELSGWKAVVGPRESSGIVSFSKSLT
ncbi:acetyl-CoA decarbonylase/synthase complex subunit gamma [Desulfosporosinus sp. BICA1-9]|uniref:acetyl-CoA decarbonylase/synthase complex subunit gamma n=1 Tax=Desulfosporosinus sp. BICA1-9 TaxID=1531958 RepID=UPI00054B210D|nr:acetyl-CoA decarbonylase/synthase complex subunit gamma [Desulfosporosinus sp. BICA1-9]KJS48144.1 MAG: acetyl-CoA decarbonylase/synthase complex subunit gamma [Peptococcaceae bacterium BRH_c23]KJS78390.1 MAG: acetyl-CoA decarbonylase/synthase complex subunit gamma [Desulfosporosinus sp. BICA1-9]HBW36555.1 acetyl-CoA decarbonylase/synthase complex subunit gamma [Desulfosporosinus sp.]